MVHGIINIYKEKGFTSHDVVAKLRGIIGQRKIGHTGTLDPDATGVLPVCLGKGTKLCDTLTDKSKVYQAVMLLGRVTDTQDISGAVIKESDPASLSEEEVSACIKGFVGTYDQIPPMYSAIKVGGKKLYELAREGKEVERSPRPVVIHNIRIMKIDLPRVQMEISCSKGTYIRTLCHDIGHALGCGGCMETLVRTQVSRFVIADSITLAQVEEYRDAGLLDTMIIPVDAMFKDYEKVVLMKPEIDRVYNGGIFKVSEGMVPEIADQEKVRVYNDRGDFIALYRYQEADKLFRVEKMFFNLDELS